MNYHNASHVILMSITLNSLKTAGWSVSPRQRPKQREAGIILRPVASVTSYNLSIFPSCPGLAPFSLLRYQFLCS